MGTVAALVCGRRLFDITHVWRGQHPVGAPVFGDVSLVPVLFGRNPLLRQPARHSDFSSTINPGSRRAWVVTHPQYQVRRAEP
ncbi:MAG: hypothetical protein ABJA34_13460 [Pseudonocardiales bacterium]